MAAQTAVKRPKATAAHARGPAKKGTAKRSTAKKTTVKKITITQERVERAAEFSDEVIKSIEAAQRAAIEAVRKFVDTVDEALPAIGDRPSRREAVIDAALDMADKLVTTQYNFLHNVVRNADRSLTKPRTAKR